MMGSSSKKDKSNVDIRPAPPLGQEPNAFTPKSFYLTEEEFPWDGSLLEKITTDLYPLIRSYYVSGKSSFSFMLTEIRTGHQTLRNDTLFW